MIRWKDEVEQSGIVKLKIEGDLTFKRLLPVLEKAEMLEAMHAHGFKRFTDLNHLRNIPLNSNEIWSISQRRKIMYKGPPVKSAIYTCNKLAFGLMRMYASMMEPAPIEVKIFSDIKECADWLGVSPEKLQNDIGMEILFDD